MFLYRTGRRKAIRAAPRNGSRHGRVRVHLSSLGVHLSGLLGPPFGDGYIPRLGIVNVSGSPPSGGGFLDGGDT